VPPAVLPNGAAVVRRLARGANTTAAAFNLEQGYRSRPNTTDPMAQTACFSVFFPTMKTRSIFMLLAAMAAASILPAAEEKPSAVTVKFNEPEKFTDAASHFNGGTDKYYLELLSEHLRKSAAWQLAPGQKLEVTFTDIDLAGEFIPSSASMADVRIVKDIYIPRMTLFFRLLDAEGKVVKEGERRLTDLNFMNNIGMFERNQPLFYDKALLTDWVRKELKP
jgi:hypothetical protein